MPIQTGNAVPDAAGDRTSPEAGTTIGKILSPAAERALAEAAARRASIVPAPAGRREIHGRGGLEPVRFGDWEVKGLTSDF